MRSASEEGFITPSQNCRIAWQVPRSPLLNLRLLPDSETYYKLWGPAATEEFIHEFTE
jgi:hypothetical protein